MSKDYYNVLGLKKGASKEDIKAAYKSLAKKYHPDISKEKNAEAKFKELSEAYAVLSDDKKREQYDNFGSEGFNQRYSAEDIFRNADFSGFEDIFGDSIFESFFGGGRRKSNKRTDLQLQIEISFEEAVFGVKKDVTLKKLDTCESCSGTGAKDKDLESCETCDGRGQVRRVQRTVFGSFSSVSTCPDCRGQGKYPKHPCHNCRGSGIVEAKKTITIKIPAGVDNGSRLRVPSEGEAGSRGSRHGDLYVHIKVKSSDIFRREDNDLYLDLPITFSQAALGDEIEVPTLDKEVKIKIKSGTQSGMHYKLAGHGIPYLDGYGRGDMYVVINVLTPNKLSREQKELFEKLKKTEEKKSILEKIKEFAKN
jgi:molecular chaperone DnaJ